MSGCSEPTSSSAAVTILPCHDGGVSDDKHADHSAPDSRRSSGAGWFVEDSRGRRNYFTDDEPVLPPPKVDRTKPKRIRFFSDDASGIALWPEVQHDFDTSSVWPEYGEGRLEDNLPVSESLRQRIRAWVDEVTAEIESGTPMADPYEHDRRGYDLSVELQAALGAEYVITYLFETHAVKAAIEGEAGPV